MLLKALIVCLSVSNSASSLLILFFTDVNGELIRDDVVENEEGVALTMDIQLIDTSTCEPLANIYTDFWHCNATVSRFYATNLPI